MIRRLSIGLACLCLTAAARADFASDCHITTNSRIAISGDSITDAHKYACYLQAYLYLHYPSLNLRVLVCSRSGTSTAGWNYSADYAGKGLGPGNEYERQVYGLNGTDVCFIMLGHNDGSDISAHLANTQDMIDDNIIGTSSAWPVLLAAHPKWSADGKPVLGDFADNYESIGTANGYPYAKVWDELLTEWVADFNATGDLVNYEGGDNGVHPGTPGHIAIARAALHLLGADTLVSTATIAANTNTTTSSSQCAISSLAMTASGGTFSRLDNRLPMAIDESGRSRADSLYHGFQESYELKITGLTAGTYTIKCDGVVIGTASHTTLAAGWNMAELTSGPVWSQGQNVLAKCRDLQGVNTTVDGAGNITDKASSVGMKRYRSSGITNYQNQGHRGATWISDAATNVGLLGSYVTAVRTAATPITRSYSIEGASGAVPVVTITVPASPPTVDDGDPITFTATATDAEDGNIASSIVWTDSVDGALGTGSSISPTLSVGFHTVTATVTDSASNVSFDTITATVESVDFSGYVPAKGIPAPAWGTFDPVLAIAPFGPDAWPSTPVANYYYIDNTHGSATDSGNTYGTPNTPRLTIPEAGFAAGARVEIHGGPYQWTSGDAEFDLDVSGTQSDPVWIVGDGIIQGRWEITGEYCVIDGLRFEYNTGQSKPPSMRFGGDVNGDCDHICLRNVTVDGGGNEISGTASSCIDFVGSSGNEVNNIVLYDVTVQDYGDITYSQTVTYSDDHAFHPGFYTNHIWFLECNVTRPAGDAIQITGNNATGEARAQYIYVGGCNFSETGENAVDVKSSLDVVVSGNTFHNFPGGLGGNGTAVVVQQEGGGGCDYVWILFNDISDCYEGVRTEEVCTNLFVIGNTIRDIYSQSGNSALTTRTSGTQTTFLDNTIHNLATGVHGVSWDGQGGTAPDLQMSGNIFSGKTDNAAFWYDGDATTVSRTSNRNAFDSGGQFRVAWEGTSYTSLASFQSGKGEESNSAYGDTALLGNLRPGPSSVARGINTEHASYAAFESRYSLDIRFDIAGNPRPSSGAWDAGAFQFVGGSATAGTVTAVTLSVEP